MTQVHVRVVSSNFNVLTKSKSGSFKNETVYLSKESEHVTNALWPHGLGHVWCLGKFEQQYRGGWHSGNILDLIHRRRSV
jgi:hypothetical protein